MKQLYFEDIQEGQGIPALEKKPDNVQLFMYLAAHWLTHRIHFDYKFSTEDQGLPDVVTPGTMPGDWYGQMLLNWIGESGKLKKLSYQLRGFSVPGDILSCQGKVIKKALNDGQHIVECELSMINQRGENIVPGAATVILPSRD